MSDELTEDALYSMSDEDLETAFQEAKAALDAEPEEEVDVNEGADEIVTNDEIVEPQEEEVEGVEPTEEPVEESDVNDEVVEPTEGDEVVEPEPEVVEETVDVTPEVEEIPKYKVKANGDEFDFTIEELMTLAPKAMDYTKKMQAMSKDRKLISALTENEIGADEINLMIDAFKGDKDAITSMIKKAGIDTLDLDVDSETNYKPTQHGLTEHQLDIKDIESRISGDVEYTKTTNVVNNEWDTGSQQKLFENPGMIEALHSDVKSGVYDVVSQMATKQKLLNPVMGMTDLDYYMSAGKQYYSDKAALEAREAETQRLEAERLQLAQAEQEKIAQAKAEQKRQADLKTQAANRKAAAPTGKTAGQKATINYLDDDNDEKFNDWYKNLQASL